MAMHEAKHRGRKRAAAKVKIETEVEGVGGPSMGNWKAEQKKRLIGHIAALEKELKGFDPQAAAEKVRSSLDLELRRKKLDLERNALEDL